MLKTKRVNLLGEANSTTEEQAPNPKTEATETKSERVTTPAREQFATPAEAPAPAATAATNNYIGTGLPVDYMKNGLLEPGTNVLQLRYYKQDSEKIAQELKTGKTL